MGTSSSNVGPSGISSLLPTWYGGDNTDSLIDNPDTVEDAEKGAETNDTQTEQPTNNPTVPKQAVPASSEKWTHARGAFTRYTKGTGGSSLTKAASQYVRTLGGSRGATRAAARGIATGGRYSNFLGSVASSGLGATLTDLGLTNLIGRSSEEILASIADAIAPTGATNDEAIARDAITATLDELYTTILENGGDLMALETLTPAMIKDQVMSYVSNYIFKKWLYELGIAIEKNTVTERDAIAMERDIKDFVAAEVRLAMENKTIRDFDLNSRANQQTIETIFQTVYSTLQ